MDTGAACTSPRVTDSGRKTLSSVSRLVRAIVAGSLAIAAAACAPAANSEASAPHNASAPARHCPIADFEAFVERFSHDVEFQQQSTADPLIIERYDTEAEPEPRRVVSETRLANVAWPILRRFDDLRAEGRTVEFGAPTGGRVELKVWMPDTSDQQIYVFAQSPCWALQRVIDESI